MLSCKKSFSFRIFTWWNRAFKISHICYWSCRLSHPTFIDILCITRTIFDHLLCTGLWFPTDIMSHIRFLASHLQKTLNFSDFGKPFPPSPLILAVKMSHLRVRGCSKLLTLNSHKIDLITLFTAARRTPHSGTPTTTQGRGNTADCLRNKSKQ